jgi:hypothetical protein
VDNCPISVDNSGKKPVDKLWGGMVFRPKYVENSAFLVDKLG